MKGADLFFVIAILIVLVLLFLLAINVDWLFPTPAASEFAKSVVPG
jgi:hypothetical protein